MNIYISVIVVTFITCFVTTAILDIILDRIHNHPIRKRVEKLAAIRDCKEDVLSAQAIIEFMQPAELRDDSGILSQGSYQRAYCIRWCIPIDFQYGWLTVKQKSMDELRTNAKLQDEIMHDYFYGTWFDDYVQRVDPLHKIGLYSVD